MRNSKEEDYDPKKLEEKKKKKTPECELTINIVESIDERPLEKGYRSFLAIFVVVSFGYLSTEGLAVGLGFSENFLLFLCKLSLLLFVQVE